MNKPTLEQINRLPQWAKEYISTLARERHTAIQTLNMAVDRQNKAPFYFEEWPCTGETPGPTPKRFYANTNRMTVEHAGVRLEIFLARQDDGQRQYGIELNYEPVTRSFTSQKIALVPRSISSIQLVAVENLR